MFLKGKVMFAPVFQLFKNYSSWFRDPERIRGDLWRCLSNYLATCVRRHLQVGAAFPVTSRSTVGSSTVAHSAKSHLAGMIIWRGTSLFTVGRNRNYLVTCVRRHLQVSKAFPFTNRPMRGLNSIAHSVTSHLVRMAIWRLTPSITVGKTAQMHTLQLFLQPGFQPQNAFKEAHRGTTVPVQSVWI